MFAFGGDALMMYYNVSYHILYGSGDHLSAMNYPDGDLIFFTAAQGSLSMFFNFINKNIVDISQYTVGIIHIAMLSMLMVSVVVMYYIYQSFNIVKWRASLFSALTLLMSPQLERMIGHHCFAYSIVIVLSILWLIRKINVTKIFEKRDVCFFLFLLFFVFNDPYTGFASSLLIALTGMVFWYFNRKETYKAAYISGIGMLAVAIVYCYLKINDPFMDRVIQQYGYFDYKATFEGLLCPQGSILDKLLILNFGKGFSTPFESIMDVGMPITITLLIYLLIYVFKPTLISDVKIPKALYYLFIGAFIVFLYASGIVFLPLTKEFVENNLGPLLMFKGVARLSWSFWYVLVILGVVLIEHYLRNTNKDGYVFALSLFIILWISDLKITQNPKFKSTVNDNFFSQNYKAEIDGILKTASIDKKDYQAILFLPRMVLWSDLYGNNDGSNFFNQFIGMRISMSTGLPLISTMLSRMPTNKGMEIIEFTSDPLIEKSLHTTFPNQKDILVVYGKGQQLSSGEQYILTISDTMYVNENYLLLKLPLNRINEYQLLKDIKNNTVTSDTLIGGTYFYESFDKNSSQVGYGINGSYQSINGKEEVIETVIDNPIDSIYTFSAWTKIDNKKYHSGIWILDVKDENNNPVQTMYFENGRSGNMHDGWIRADLDFAVKKGYRIVVSFEGNRPLLLDEILIKPKSKNYLFKDKMLYNNYLIKK